MSPDAPGISSRSTVWHRVCFRAADGILLDLGVALAHKDKRGFDLYVHTFPLSGSMTLIIAGPASDAKDKD